jgi:hypothetical protein
MHHLADGVVREKTGKGDMGQGNKKEGEVKLLCTLSDHPFSISILSIIKLSFDPSMCDYIFCGFLMCIVKAQRKVIGAYEENIDFQRNMKL